MNYCRFVSNRKKGVLYNLCIIIPVAIVVITAAIALIADLLLGTTFREFLSQRLMLAGYLLFLLAGLFVLRIGLESLCFENRKYTVSSSGITVKNVAFKKETYRWENIAGVCISVFAGNGGLQKYDTVLCVFLEPIPRDFHKKIVQGYMYATRNIHRLVVLDYSETLVNEIKAVCPMKIIDYREMQIGQYGMR